MSNFDGLIFLTQLQQNSRLADVRDGIDCVHAQLNHLHRQQAQAAQAQQRLDYLRQEIFTFGQNLQQTFHNMDQTAGLACYWSFRFLLWASREGVGTNSFSEYQDKHIFSEVLKRAHDILNHSAQRYYSPEELSQIERYMFLDCGMWGRHKAYLNWKKIQAIAAKHRFLFSSLLKHFVKTAFWVSFIGFFVLSAFAYYRNDTFVPVWIFPCLENAFLKGLLVMLSACVIRAICFLVKKRIVQNQLSPLATETGGFITERITTGEIQKIISEIKAELVRDWGNNIHLYDFIEDIERYHQELTDEYFGTKQDFVENPPSRERMIINVTPPPLLGS